jgi:hypothetical protein
MRVLITSNSHRHYDRTGTITRKIGPIGGRTYWTVRLDSGGVTTVSDGQFSIVKRQESDR